MKLKKRFKKIRGKLAKRILEILIYFEQKRIGKCEVVLHNGKIIINIYVTQKSLFKDSKKYFKCKMFIKTKIDNSTTNYILDGLDINRNISIVNFDSKLIIKNCKINAPIDLSVRKVEFENNIYPLKKIIDFAGTSIGGNAHYLKFKNENIDNNKLVLSFKSKKFEIENSDLNIDDINLDTKYLIVQNSDIKLNQLEILDSEVSYFKDSNVKSNSAEINTGNFVNKNSKINTFTLKYNGKIIDCGNLLKINTTPLDCEKYLRATLTSKLIKLKKQLENSKKQITEKVCKDLDERKVKKYLKK